MLVKDGRVLLGRRHPDPDKAGSAFGKTSAGAWSLPGGKLEWGESFEACAIREVKEEAGIDIKNPEVISVHNCRNEHAHFVTIGLLVREWEGEPQVLEPDEMVEWQWFDLDHLPYPRYFPSFEVIENYRQGKYYLRRD